MVEEIKAKHSQKQVKIGSGWQRLPDLDETDAEQTPTKIEFMFNVNKALSAKNLVRDRAPNYIWS